MANRAGSASATTLIIPLRRGWSLWCRLLFAAANRWSFISDPLREQSFIHIARWTIVRELGGNDLGHACLYFESNFDFSMSEYIDVFVQAVPWHMRMVWAGGLHYPGLYPSEDYHRWSEEHANSVQHYYAGYPDATTTAVTAALEVTSRIDNLAARAADLDADEFDEAYDALLKEVSRWL